jgi:hypothetical protein
VPVADLSAARANLPEALCADPSDESDQDQDELEWQLVGREMTENHGKGTLPACS